MRRLKLLGQISPSVFTTPSNYQQICLVYLLKKKVRKLTVNPTFSVNIWFNNYNCKTLLEGIGFGFIMCIYHLSFQSAECPQVHWEATGTQEIAACNIPNSSFESFLSLLENWAQKWNGHLGTFITFEQGVLALCLRERKLNDVRFSKKGSFNGKTNSTWFISQDSQGWK